MTISTSDMNRITAIEALCECLADHIGRVYTEMYIGGDDSPDETIAGYLRMIGEMCSLLSPEFKEATRPLVKWESLCLLKFILLLEGEYSDEELLEIADTDIFQLSKLCDDWLDDDWLDDCDDSDETVSGDETNTEA